ncbi:hypothetical protein [Methylophaga thalassica]|uniref:hypothetical protein n=1 Tax=Methylophaga aminisulfidivorans TaxID=230105 RepID=UPI003A8EE7EC
MFTLDHLMIEVDDPQQTANHVAEFMGLPFAWPLMAKEEYTSIGVNFGDINIEFIKFNVRFGQKGSNFHGFSGMAYKDDASLQETMSRLEAAQLHYRIGEDCETHTTLPIEDDKIFPTLFLVKYHFDTSGWTQRLHEEFAACSGGKFHIGGFQSLAINSNIPDNVTSEFQLRSADKNQIVFTSPSGQKQVISDLIDNLDIIIG